MSRSAALGEDLDVWLTPFLEVMGRSTRRRWGPLYVRGLLGPDGPKSVQPIAARLGLSGHDQLHHFVSSPAWDDAPLELPNLLDVVWRHADETGEAYLPVSSPRFILKGGRPDDAVRLRFQTRLSGALKLTHCPIESRSMRWRRPKLLSRGSPSANGFAQSPWICSDTLSGLRDRPWTLRRPSPQRC